MVVVLKFVVDFQGVRLKLYSLLNCLFCWNTALWHCQHIMRSVRSFNFWFFCWRRLLIGFFNQLAFECRHNRVFTALSPQKIDSLNFFLVVQQPPVSRFKQTTHHHWVVPFPHKAFVVVQRVALLRCLITFYDLLIFFHFFFCLFINHFPFELTKNFTVVHVLLLKSATPAENDLLFQCVQLLSLLQVLRCELSFD